MTTITPTTAGHLTSDAAAGPAPTGRRRRVPFAVVVAAAVLSGLVNTLLLVLVVFAGGTEPVITGAGLVGLASGWALLAALTTRCTDRPQRWAAVPAAVMAATGAGLLAVTPGNGTLTAAGWVWPPVALVLAVWMARTARRATTGRARWLLYPVIALVTVTAVAGAVETVTLARDHGRFEMTGALYDVGGHRLHLTCTGTGSPTVVLENGLNEISPLWSGITAQVSRTTRVCSYDRAGQGWSDDVAGPQDGREVAADLHTLLARAGEPGPYVLAGHSSGGTPSRTAGRATSIELSGDSPRRVPAPRRTSRATSRSA